MGLRNFRSFQRYFHHSSSSRPTHKCIITANNLLKQIIKTNKPMGVKRMDGGSQRNRGHHTCIIAIIAIGHVYKLFIHGR